MQPYASSQSPLNLPSLSNAESFKINGNTLPSMLQIVHFPWCYHSILHMAAKDLEASETLGTSEDYVLYLWYCDGLIKLFHFVCHYFCIILQTDKNL